MNLSVRLAAALSLFVCISGVQAACVQDLQNLDSRYGDIRLTPLQQKRIWHEKNAALTLNKRGKADLCHDLIQDIGTQLRDLGKLDKDNPPVKYEQNARKPVSDTEHLFKAADIIGSPVINLSNDMLGIIEAVTFESMTGKISYVVMDSGHLLDTEPSPVAIPWDKLSWIDGEHVFVVDSSGNSLKRAPQIGANDWPDSVDSSWIGAGDDSARDRPREQ